MVSKDCINADTLHIFVDKFYQSWKSSLFKNYYICPCIVLLLLVIWEILLATFKKSYLVYSVQIYQYK